MRLRYALLFGCAAAAVSNLYAAANIPLSAFVEEDKYSKPRLSPDGKYLAVTVRVPGKERLVPVVSIYSLPELKIVGGVRMPDYQMPLSYTWLSNTRLAITKAAEKGSLEAPVTYGEVQATEFDGSKQEYLFGYNMAKYSRRGERYGDDWAWGDVEGVPTEPNGHLFLTAHLWQDKHSVLYDIDSLSGIRKQLADLPHEGLSFRIQRNGKPRFAYGIGEDAYAINFRYNDSTGGWDKQVGNFGKVYQPLAFSADDTEFVAIYSADGGPSQLIKEKLAGGDRSTLFADPHGSVDDLMYGATPGLPFGAISTVGIPFPRYFDPDSEDAKLHQLLSAQFPDNYVEFLNFTRDGGTVLFSVRSDRDPGSYYLFHRKTMKADFLFAAMEQIRPQDMAERRPISFKARDGLSLYGFLTMPKHGARAKLPMVLLPHGGPHGAHDSWFFDRDAQFLASRGYAVLQINFRGSGGRGVNFQAAGYRRWGSAMQDDLADGIAWAIAQGEVDGERVCAYGGSFGAYASLTLAARTPALLKCAAGYAGVYDLKLLFKKYATRSDKTTFNYYDKWLGQDHAELDRFSPVTMAGRITVPVLLVHGDKDESTPIEHAELMREALVKVNRPPEWLVAKNEGHGFYNTKNLTLFYEKLEAFLDKHIGH